MRKIVFGFCALTVATWLLNLGFNPPAMNGRSLTHEVFFLNGVLAWGLMAMAIVIGWKKSRQRRLMSSTNGIARLAFGRRCSRFSTSLRKT